MAERPADTAKAARKEARETAAAERRALLEQRRPLVKEAERLEKQLAGWQGEKADVDDRLADPELYAAPDREALETLLKRQAGLAAAIETAEERWLEVQTLLESLPAA